AYPPACAVATVVPPCRGSTGAVGGTRAASLPRMAAVTQPSWPGGRAPLRCGRADAPVVRGLRRRRPPVAGPVLVGGDGLAGRGRRVRRGGGRGARGQPRAGDPARVRPERRPQGGQEPRAP